MRGPLRAALFAGAIVAGPISLAACGSGTKVVTTTTPPTPIATTSTESASAATASTSITATTPSPQGTGGTAAASTRTAEAPAYAREAEPAAQLAAAVTAVKAHGYTPNDTSQYHAGQTLRVLVGTRSGSGDGYGQLAFFFIGGRYIGTDSSQPSATLSVAYQGDTEVTLSYPSYRTNDPLCCASGGSTRVTFALNNGHLTPLQAIPPTSTRR
ncbi:MAG: LppP/LprE family lipoprotein [Acidobacteriota bacterium]|nr:LppP/LprE family lipoprotein [Acidobacteriota bacterium]